MPALGVSLILIIVGAVLTFVVGTIVAGAVVAATGVIIMAVGFAGLLVTLLFLLSFSPFANRDYVDTPERHGHRR